MTATKATTARHARSARSAHRLHDLEELHATDTAQIRALQAVIANHDVHIAALKDFIETQDEAHADEMALLTNLNESVNDRLNKEVSARQERMPSRNDQSDEALGELMGRVRVLVAAQAYEILAGYGTHYRELAHAVNDCLEALEGYRPRDPKEPLFKAMQAIKSSCHTLADNIVVCRAGGIHENFRALWPGSLESIEVSTGPLKNRDISARYVVEE